MNLLDELERLEKEATPGYHWHGDGLFGKTKTGDIMIQGLSGRHFRKEDKEFIAASRNAVPKLIAALRVAIESLSAIREGTGRSNYTDQGICENTLNQIEELLK